VLALPGAPPAGTLAHPLTQPFQLPVSPLVAAAAGAVIVFVVALAMPRGPRRIVACAGARISAESRLVTDALTASWAGSLSRPQVVTRFLAVALLGLSIAAGRLGADDQLENLAPALVVGVAWPVLVLASLVLGPVWRWLDPWDAMARALAPGGEGPGATVWPAAIVALPWVSYLSADPDPLSPRSVGAILALYSVFTVAGCLVLGRDRWLSTAEPLGIALSWMALLPRRRLAGWVPPLGAEALLGVLAGGVLFGAIRRSELWGSLNTVDGALAFAILGVLTSAGLVVGLLVWFGRQARNQGAAGSMALAAVPALAGIVVAVAMDRNRLSTSLQLLPGLLGDPFGRGWDLFGAAGARLDPAPLGTTGLSVAQYAVLLAGHLAGAIVLARGVDRGAREPAALGLSLLLAASVIALVTH
jgi:hypothetical protein